MFSLFSAPSLEPVTWSLDWPSEDQIFLQLIWTQLKTLAPRLTETICQVTIISIGLLPPDCCFRRFVLMHWPGFSASNLVIGHLSSPQRVAQGLSCSLLQASRTSLNRVCNLKVKPNARAKHDQLFAKQVFSAWCHSTCTPIHRSDSSECSKF